MSTSTSTSTPSLFAFSENPAPAEPAWCTPENLAEMPGTGLALDVENTLDVHQLSVALHRIALIRLHFPAFADGRAYSQARVLRRLGFSGHLRATGKAIALDQALEQRAAGFDSVELREDQSPARWTDWLARQPQAGLFSADRSHPFQDRSAG